MLLKIYILFEWTFTRFNFIDIYIYINLVHIV